MSLSTIFHGVLAALYVVAAFTVLERYDYYTLCAFANLILMHLCALQGRLAALQKED